MGKRSVELDTYNCTYCGWEAININSLKGQEGATRYICGECMIKAFDKGLGYEAPKAETPADTETAGPIAATESTGGKE